MVAEEEIAANKLRLWPCIPRGCKVLEPSVHPHAVKVSVKVMAQVDEELDKKRKDSAASDGGCAKAVWHFYVNPEMLLPLSLIHI